MPHSNSTVNTSASFFFSFFFTFPQLFSSKSLLCFLPAYFLSQIQTLSYPPWCHYHIQQKSTISLGIIEYIFKFSQIISTTTVPSPFFFNSCHWLVKKPRQFSDRDWHSGFTCELPRGGTFVLCPITCVLQLVLKTWWDLDPAFSAKRVHRWSCVESTSSSLLNHCLLGFLKRNCLPLGIVLKIPKFLQLYWKQLADKRIPLF